MPVSSMAIKVLASEAQSMLTRLERIQPFALNMPMVTAANISLTAQHSVERFLISGRRRLREQIYEFIEWLNSPKGRSATPYKIQRKFTLCRLQFNSILSQFDVFADVLSQRSQHDVGVWLAGLDSLAEDALNVSGVFYNKPPIVCYLDRGIGAAIRRVQARLPGGGQNPIAIIRVPRERMIGSGLASSIIHEVGHQVAVLLNLINPLKVMILNKNGGNVWKYWERWIAEILADFWSVAKVGISSTFGLFGVLSLPYPLVFIGGLDDSHPVPWIRLKISCAIGNELYPHPQWQNLADLWELFYPLDQLSIKGRHFIKMLESGIPNLIDVIMNYRPKVFLGKTLKEVMASEERQPYNLDNYFRLWSDSPALMRDIKPTLAFAVIGQAKINEQISPEEESNTIANLLKYWALRKALDVSAVYSRLSKSPIMTAIK